MTVACLIVRAGPRTSGLPVGDVLETMRPLPTMPVPGLPSFVLGAAIIRGKPLPVVDLARLFGDAVDEPARRYVTLRAGERRVALAVSDVLGIASIDDALFASADPLAVAADAGFIAAIAARDARLFALLDAARILPEGAWSTFGGEVPRGRA